ncbi:hypothetical protein RB595_002716 [Gaeumannomyces hyphopodioides]
MPGVPLRYPWRGSLTWSLKGDPRRYSTFPPYTDGHPLEGIGGKVVDCTKAFFVRLFCILRLLLWNVLAGLIIGTVAGAFICRNGHIKVLERTELRPLKTRFQGDISQGIASVQSPRSAVDSAWGSVGANLRSIVISEAEGVAAGLGRDHVQVSEAHGGGYVVDILGFGHLECLNKIRKALHSEKHRSGSKLGKSIPLGHTQKTTLLTVVFEAHCLQTIQQQLICRADLGVRGQLWWNRSDPQPGPDLAVKENSCHNFHAIQGLIERRQIPQKIPPGFYLQPHPDQILDTGP